MPSISLISVRYLCHVESSHLLVIGLASLCNASLSAQSLAYMTPPSSYHWPLNHEPPARPLQYGARQLWKPLHLAARPPTQGHDDRNGSRNRRRFHGPAQSLVWAGPVSLSLWHNDQDLPISPVAPARTLWKATEITLTGSTAMRRQEAILSVKCSRHWAPASILQVAFQYWEKISLTSNYSFDSYDFDARFSMVLCALMSST
jgi:hypothetical protein